MAGRIFFDKCSHDNLDIGRPDHVSFFDRRIIAKGRARTPERFRTRNHRRGYPQPARRLQEHQSQQNHKQGRALRTETTINPHDFRVTKRLTSLPELRQIGFTANRRLLGVQPSATTPSAARHSTTSPPRSSPRKAPASRGCASARPVHALVQALLVHRLLVHGFTP